MLSRVARRVKEWAWSELHYLTLHNVPAERVVIHATGFSVQPRKFEAMPLRALAHGKVAGPATASGFDATFDGPLQLGGEGMIAVVAGWGEAFDLLCVFPLDPMIVSDDAEYTVKLNIHG